MLRSELRALHRLTASTLGLACLLATGTAAAVVAVRAVATATPGGYLYEITVDNGLADDVVLVTLEPAPTSDALLATSLVAPAGFGTSYDSQLGIVDLIESSSVFGAGTVTPGFSFESPADPMSGVIGSFVAYTAQLGSESGAVELDVPEPSAGTVWRATPVALAWLARRRRRREAGAPA